MTTPKLSDRQVKYWRIAALIVGGIGNAPLVLMACLRAMAPGCGMQEPVGNVEYSVLGLATALGCFSLGHAMYNFLAWALCRWGHVGQAIAMFGPVGGGAVSVVLAGGIALTAAC